MKILSLNAWGGKLYEPLKAHIETECRDVLCLQEVVHSPVMKDDWPDYRDGSQELLQRANLFREVACLLPDHVAFFCPAAQGVLWNGRTSIPSQWGLATFVHKSLPIVAQAQGFVHKTFSPHGYGDHPRSRNAHVIRVYDFHLDRAVCIAHMHGLRDPAGKMDTPERRKQAGNLAALVAQVAVDGEPLVVCGDFNVEPNSETFEILGSIGLTDLVVRRGFTGTRTSHYPEAGRFADYMLVNEHVKVADFSVVTEPEVSDHCPLRLTIG
jgi:endonuclease/exonuclease/phosphatase family metal-dependent hydrolase